MDDARTLLSRIPALQGSCDLDLLAFFAKHQRTLLTSEHLARLLGYPLKEIAQSLDVLLGAGFLTLTQNLTHPSRMYVFTPDSTHTGALSAVVALASTREGRLALRRAVTHSTAGFTDEDEPQTDRPVQGEE